MATTFTPSPEQLTIRDALLAQGTSPPNLLVEAVAGSGKTTTILWLCSQIPERRPGELLQTSILFLAFNKAIADTLASRCPKNVACSTFHSLGLRALKSSGLLPPSFRIDARKVPKLVWNKMHREDPDIKGVIKLVSLLKSQSYECDPLTLVSHFDIDFADERRACQLALEILNTSDRDLSVLDFDDMLHLPLLLDVEFQKQDWIFVDEAQDTNDVQTEILARLCKSPRCDIVDECAMDDKEFYTASPTTLVFVGDPHQAIYGFRGANASALEKIRERFRCVSLPLSVSYRCPKAVIREVQRYMK